MKFTLTLVIGVLFLSGYAQNKIEEVQRFQDELNLQYGDSEKSPLTMEDYVKFVELPFFKIDTNYIVVASLELTPDDSIFKMKTSTERTPDYRRYAIATFELNGAVHKLSLYESMRLKGVGEYKNYLFLPFKDHTNGGESYGGGRYIDLEKTGDITMTIDFNKAYNPYCAYNDRFSCPVVPAGNVLETEVKAGVKAPAHK